MRKTQWDLYAIRNSASRIGLINDGPRRKYTLRGREIECLVDTLFHIIGETTFNSLNPKPKLEPCETGVFPYGQDDNTPIPMLGQFTACMEYKGKRCTAGFVVTKGEEEALMSFATAENYPVK